MFKTITINGFLDSKPIINSQPLFNSFDLVLETLKRLIYSWHAARTPTITFNPPLNVIHRKNFITICVTITSLEGIFCLMPSEVNWFTIMLE